MPPKPTNFTELSKKKYSDQARWFINGFWDDLGPEGANKIWDYVKKFVDLDNMSKEKRGENGNELDQFWSAKFLEDMDVAIPAAARKEELKKIDQDSNGKMSAIEYFTWKFKKTPQSVLDAPQGDNTELIAQAQKALDEVSTALNDVMSKIAAQEEAIRANNAKVEEQKEAIARQQAAIASQQKVTAELSELEAALKKAEDEVRAQEEIVRTAEKELQDAIAALTAQEEAYKAKMKQLEEASAGTGVAAGKAKAELASLKQEDPLPLRKAKLTQEAALRKVTKEREIAESKTAAAKEKTDEAAAKRAEADAKLAELAEIEKQLKKVEEELVEAGRQLEEAKRQLEEAQNELQVKMEAAQKELEAVKALPGKSYGDLYWMDRTLFEADKSVAKARQRYDHSKPYMYTP